jgi:hypothetical protein
MPPESHAKAALKPTASSKVTNGSLLVEDADQRTRWVRRLRDLMALHIADLGGPDNISEAERSIIRRAATLTVELEQMEAKFAVAGGAGREQLYQYQTCSNTLRRLLETVGMKRRPKNVGPTLDQYIEQEPFE